MPKKFNPDSWKIGGLCPKHPELGGLRLKSNATCFQCCKDDQKRLRDKKRASVGLAPFVWATPEEAKNRIREQDNQRNLERRKNPEYKEKQIARKKAWRLANQEKHRASCRAYDAKQLSENLQRRISKNLRNRLRKAMLGISRSISAIGDLGISIPDFREYMQRKFYDGMSWENYGKWHIDHIIPLIAFDLKDESQARKACHYSNLQPLWAIENIRKHGNIPVPIVKGST